MSPVPGDDIERLAAAVADALDGRSLAAAESCTAGRLAAALAQGGDAESRGRRA